MNIMIQSRGFNITPAIKVYVEDRITFILARYGTKVSKVYVTLLDINGPKGGMDKRCRVQVKLQGAEPVIIQETQNNLYDAILACASRLRRTVGRKLAHPKKSRHRVTEHLNESMRLEA